jgi:hypothetical protein
MRNSNDNRVLGRQGSRELTPEEVARAMDGGDRRIALRTDVITFNPYTHSLDGDGATLE